MTKRTLTITLSALILVLCACFLAWDAVTRRPLRKESKRQFVVQQQTLADEPETDA